MKKPQLKTD